MLRYLLVVAFALVVVESARSAPLPSKLRNPNRVLLKTSLGDIVIELYPKKAPKSVANFIRYVEDDFYKGTIFHRVVPNFVIQGGGFDVHMNEKKTRAPVVNEATNGLSNERGTLAVARTQEPDSGTSQFYINLKDNSFLDKKPGNGPRTAGYCVFGKVVEGMDIVDQIGRLRTEKRGMFQDVPETDVVIEKARRGGR